MRKIEYLSEKLNRLGSKIPIAMASIRCTFWKEDDLCGARDNASLREPAVSLPLITLDRDVTHLLVKVGAGGNKTTASHRVQRFPEYKLILNQAGCCVIQGKELRKMTVCPRHRRTFTRLRELSGPSQHPLHNVEKRKIEETEESNSRHFGENISRNKDKSSYSPRVPILSEIGLPAFPSLPHSLRQRLLTDA